MAEWTRGVSVGGVVGAVLLSGMASAADPYASNNGFYPTQQEWSGPLRTAHFAYPRHAVEPAWKPGGPVGGRITTANAGRFMAALKKLVEPSLKKLVESPDAWDAAREGWYDMPWTGVEIGADGNSDPCGGRDAILQSYSGQLLRQDSFASSGLRVDMQNFTVIYYDPVSAAMLGRLWADPFRPAVKEARFPEGAIVVKAGAVTPTPDEWPVLEGTGVWHVYRPHIDPAVGHCVYDARKNPPVVQALRLLQFDIIVKDRVAAPATGWIFSTFVYDKDAPGKGTWDKLVPLGAQWGNDPKYAREPDGNGPHGELDETWINPKAPKYALGTLGWGGRLSGPIDVSQRHNVLLTDGTRLAKTEASSCMSCHGTSQFPFTNNLYPSPNLQFPPEDQTFLMHPPGSRQWARWNQNRPGRQAMSGDRNAVGLDYDMLITFSLGSVNSATGEAEFAFRHPGVR